MNDSSLNGFTLITGGSKGIGRAFAEVCASEGRNLLLIALPGEGLKETALMISQQSGVEVRTLEIDLTLEESPGEIYRFCQENGMKVDFIINNAGFGTVGRFADSDLNQHLAMLKLNMVAPYQLMRLFLPDLALLPTSGILNVSSQAGLLPVPYKGTYSATKGFMYYLSMAMAYEEQNGRVHIGCLMPSGVPTNDSVKKRIRSAGWVGKLSMVEPHDVARYAMKCMRKKKRIIIPGFINRVAYAISVVTPLSLNMHFAATQVKKDMKR